MTRGFGHRALFLDRDGVINVDTAYVHRWEDYRFVDGALDAIRRLSLAGYRVVVVTNQSGIARGYFTEAQYQTLNRHIVKALVAAGADLAGVYHCPHHPEGIIPQLAVDCDCRKPAPGLILRAADEHGLSVADSVMVGDKPSDIAAARAAGVGQAFLVRSDNDESTRGGEDLPPGCDGLFENLAAIADAFLARR